MIKPGLYSTRLVGTGRAVPEGRLTNADLEKMVQTNDDWIVSRTGIRERRIAGSHDTTASLAAAAGRAALRRAGLDANELDLLIVATLTPDMPTPSTACLVQHELGVPSHAAAFDLNAACSGFIYGLATAAQFVQTGACRHALVIGAETLSRFVDYTDRNTCVLFGDGAGAAVLSATEDAAVGLRSFRLGADGAGASLIRIPAGGSRSPASAATIAERMHFLKMNGREVYRFAVDKMCEGIDSTMRACGLQPHDVKLVVPHQVNARILDTAAERLGLPREKLFVNIDRYGNTSSASVPIALDEAVEAGRCGPNDWVILVAFGAGLTWASAAVRL